MSEGAAAVEDRVTPEQVRGDPEVSGLIRWADQYLEVIGYTDHGFDHVDRVARRAFDILRQLDYSLREAELAAIAGYLHDIGNIVHREGHPMASALMAWGILERLKMPLEEAAIVGGAIGNHDESNGDPTSAPTAALIISDKSDILRSRVRNPKMINFDIHDRVNYAARAAELKVDKPRRLITLQLVIDTSISTVMEYFEIFLSRMGITRRAATFLNCDFKLVINDVELT
ncbi:MAG: HD domain-containing protein [Candidatus Sumerlaeota bacterium]|nr:HD domain-containing protein [Candidatus Sumerlaeota bacterium]